MKFYGLFKFFKNRSGNKDKNDVQENVGSTSSLSKVAANSSVVRFEDCERINRERFAIENSRLSSTNQYYAVLSGKN